MQKSTNNYSIVFFYSATNSFHFSFLSHFRVWPLNRRTSINQRSSFENNFSCFFLSILSYENICFLRLTSDKRPATTAPADPPPTTIKSYSVSKATRLFGRLHGSSISHWDLMNTSSSPMNTINAVPPHALAKVGPGSVAGQLQLIVACKVKICDYWVENWRWDERFLQFLLEWLLFVLYFGASLLYHTELYVQIY